jgi:hypothetical protein
MSQSEITRDAAVAAAAAILDEFFFVYPDEQARAIGARLAAIVQAAIEASLEFQRREVLKASDN